MRTVKFWGLHWGPPFFWKLPSRALCITVLFRPGSHFLEASQCSFSIEQLSNSKSSDLVCSGGAVQACSGSSQST